MVIVSSSFCNTDKIKDLDEVRNIFMVGINEIRTLEYEASAARDYFSNNQQVVNKSVEKIIEIIKAKNS